MLLFLFLLSCVTSTELRSQRSSPIKVQISDCSSHTDHPSSSLSSSSSVREMDLAAGSSLVLSHHIQLVPSGSGSCSCELDFSVLRQRVETLEKEMFVLKEKCCHTKERKGCPDDCSDQGRCVDGRCVCFAGFTGTDCSESDCPGSCTNRGRCVDSRCVCDEGFTGLDCSQTVCVNDCSSNGDCVDGQCVCFPGFTGTDCSETSCPGSCTNRGRCVDGRCVCSAGFTGTDCSETDCPGSCTNRGRCVDGRCVCSAGFTGTDCSETDCPGSCTNRGRCVDGRCVCSAGFTGTDCSETDCPGSCTNRGRCVDGRCVCSAGFTGTDCSESDCPGSCTSRGRCVDSRCVCDEGFTGLDCSHTVCVNDCSSNGRCVDGQCVCFPGFTGADCSVADCAGSCTSRGRCVDSNCVCDEGFTGLDCSQCEEGRSGENCQSVLSVVSQLSAQDVTDTSVTLVWTSPSVQYDVYYITFSSQKESDEQITSQVDGVRSSFTQSGLATGQRYSVSVVGEVRGQRGPESTTHFLTRLAPPSDLRVLKTTSSSAVVQWIESPALIDSYRLTVTPADGQGQSQEITVLAGRSSAHIIDLEAGRLYVVELVAERGGARSEAVTNQVVPGPEPPSDLVFSDVMENSVTVSWTKPKSDVSGFKITYMHSEEDEPVSVWVESDVSSYQLSRLAPGSSYEVTLISTLGLQESEAIADHIMTLPDPPTDMRVVNITERSALLSWQPVLTSIDKYTIVYGTDTGSQLRVTVEGNVVEHQLRDLSTSTTYTVTISSQLGALESSKSSSTFTTASTSSSSSSTSSSTFTTATETGNDRAQDLQATNITPRTATLSWIPPSLSASSYRLTYQTEGAEPNEVIVDASLTQLELKRLVPGSFYVVHLQAEFGGKFHEGVSTRFTTGTLLFPFPSDCTQELLNGILASSEVVIYPLGELGPPLMVYCDMDTDGGGWTVFQRRKDGSVDFFRGWKDYVNGFGDPNGEFWLGLQALNNLTSMTKMSLRVDLGVAGESAHAHYSQFEVGKRNYRLTVAGYSGTAGDSLSYHNQRPFSTRDRDLAPFITRCAMSYRGGWWYKNCHQANLNGLYGVDVRHQGIIWTSWKGKDSSVSFTEMKVRPATFKPPTRG